MIVRRMPNTSHQKSKLANVSDIYMYICGLKDLDHTVLSTFTFNLNPQNTDEANIADIYDLAAVSTRAQSPVEHWVLSLAEGDSFDGKEYEVISMFLRGLGYDGCQCVGARHGGTGNDHLHLAINRVDPVTGKCRSDSFCKEKAHKVSALIAHKFGFKTEPKARYKIEDNEIVRMNYPETNEVRISDRARAEELRTGAKSMQRVSAETIVPILLNARTWEEVHSRLAEQGCAYVKKGGGAVIRTTLVDGTTVDVKPSSLHKQASLKHMEGRLGAYAETAPDNVVMPRKPEPLDGIPQSVFDAYRANQGQIQSEKDDYADFRKEMAVLKAERKKMIEAVMSMGGWKGHGAELASFLKAIKEHSEEETAFLLARYEEKAAKQKAMKDRVTPFDVWIRHQPMADAVNMKAFDASQAIVRIDATINEHNLQSKMDAFALYHQAVGADRYRVTVGNEKKTTLEKLEMFDECKKLNKPFNINEYKSVGYTPDVLKTKLQSMTNHEINKNEHVYLTPLSEDKSHILVDDVSKEQILRMKSFGLRPSCIIESSPNNYQLIFTLPKFGVENEEKIVNDLATGLNDTFGDVNCCGTSHPHRAPGFYNVKDKYKREDNTYPTVRIVEAQGGSCPVLSRYIADIADYYEKSSADSKLNIPARNQQHAIVCQTTQQQIGLYDMHREHIIRNSKFQYTDESRVDYMVAMRLRGAGHTQNEIASIIAAKRQDKQNPYDYGNRTAQAVFSSTGDMRLAELAAYHQQWIILEQNYANSWAIIKQRQIKQNQQRYQESKAEEREVKAKERRDRMARDRKTTNDFNMPRM